MLRSWLALAVALHVALATLYAWRTPNFEAPDENSHYEYAQHLANCRTLPLAPALAQARGLPMTEGAQLAHHPPLYYVLLAAALVVTGTDDTVFGPNDNEHFGDAASPAQHLKYVHGQSVHRVLLMLRLVSVALGALSIVFVHRLGRACCPDAPRVADLAALLVACLPMWSFLHGALNSDVLATTLSCATVLALVRTLQAEAPSWRRALAIGALLGLALLTKLTALFLAPLAAAVFLAVAWRERSTGRAPLVLAQGAAAAGVALALAGWWFARNQVLYGDPLAQYVHDAAFPPIPPQYRWGYFTDGFLPNIFSSLLGTFGWFSLKPCAALLWTARVTAGLALFGLLRAVFGRERAALPRPSWLLWLTLALVFAGTARFNWTAPQPQGRLLFPAIGPAAVVVAAGLVRASAPLRWRRWLAVLPPLTALLVFALWFSPAFARELAPAPAWHRSLVGRIRSPRASPTIVWREQLALSLEAPPVLRWTDAGAPADTRYTLYALGEYGRVWLATHEWSHGAIVAQGGEFAMPESVLAMLPKDVPLSFVLRRVPATADEVPAMLPVSAPLPFRLAGH